MRRILASAFAFGLTTLQVHAEETKTVVITGLGYFPAVTYVVPGDKIRFYNGSDSVQSIKSDAAPEGSGLNAWEVSDIAPGSEYTVTAATGFVLTYHDKYDSSRYAAFSFDAPPN